MINNREIYQIQKDIEDLKNSKPELDLSITTGVKFNITKADFSLDQTLGFFVANLNHNLNQEVECFSISFYTTEKEYQSLDYKILDNNNIQIHSDEAVDIIVSIKQGVQASHHNHDDVYSKLIHTHVMDDITDLVFPESGGAIKYIETFEEFKAAVERKESIINCKPNCTIKFTEKVIINHETKIKGNGALVVFDNLDEGLEIAFSNQKNLAVIENMIITSKGSGGYYTTKENGDFNKERYCIKIRGTANANGPIIKNCTFKDTEKHGLYIWIGFSTAVCTECNFHRSGVNVSNTNGAIISNCTFDTSYIYATGNINLVITECYIERSDIYLADKSIKSELKNSTLISSKVNGSYESEGIETKIINCKLDTTDVRTGGLSSAACGEFKIINCYSDDGGVFISGGYSSTVRPIYNFTPAYNNKPTIPIEPIDISTFEIFNFIGFVNASFYTPYSKIIFDGCNDCKTINSTNVANHGEIIIKNTNMSQIDRNVLRICNKTINSVEYFGAKKLTLTGAQNIKLNLSEKLTVEELTLKDSTVEFSNSINVTKKIIFEKSMIRSSLTNISDRTIANVSSNSKVLCECTHTNCNTEEIFLKYEDKKTCKVVVNNSTHDFID